MRRLFLFWISAAALAIGIVSCDSGFQGNVDDNQAPETHTVVDTIMRSGPDRFNSEVHIRWWGDDPDGVVVGYEYRFDGGSWNFIAQNDSVFILSPPVGRDTIDFTFEVRAIDNNGAADPTPAALVYPIKNSVPSIAFEYGASTPSISFPVVRYSWEATDPDGAGNLNEVELVWNDTNNAYTALDVNNTSVTFQAVDVQASTTDANIYLNNNDQPEPGTVSGLRLNDTNRLYIRAVDNSGARSAWVASRPVFLKKVQSPILLVNAYNGTSVEAFYTDQMRGLGLGTFDSMRIFATNAAGALTQQSADNLTQSRIFNLFDVIVWFGDNAEKSLSLAQRTTSRFFDDGGRMLMAVYVSSVFDEQSQFFDFTPVETLISFSDTTLLLTDTSAVQPQLSGWPQLQSTQFVGIVKPIVPSIGVTPLYTSELVANDKANSKIFNWPGNSNVIVRQQSGGKTYFVMSVLELQILNGNNNIDQFLEKVLIDEFGL